MYLESTTEPAAFVRSSIALDCERLHTARQLERRASSAGNGGRLHRLLCRVLSVGHSHPCYRALCLVAVVAQGACVARAPWNSRAGAMGRTRNLRETFPLSRKPHLNWGVPRGGRCARAREAAVWCGGSGRSPPGPARCGRQIFAGKKRQSTYNDGAQATSASRTHTTRRANFRPAP